MAATGEMGKITWIDLGTPDVEASQAFYRALFDWKFEEAVYDEGSYLIAQTDAGPVAGMMAQSDEERSAGIPAMWSVFFATADIDDAVRRVREAGGTVLREPFMIPDGDRIALVADPAGAVFALATFTAVEAGGLRWDEPGSACWVECQTRDVEASVGFYEAIFGWTAHRSGEYVVFELGGDQVAGLLPMPEAVPAEAPSHWFTYWRVDDLEAAVGRAGDLGGTQLFGPMTIDEGRFSVVQDDTGAVIGLFEAVAIS